MGQEELEVLLQFFKALADENRLKILGLVANREYSVEELAAFLNLKAPTVSHHLSKLKELNLVNMRADGNTHVYTLNGEAIRESNKRLLTPERIASLVETGTDEDEWERKVLDDFMEGDKVKQLPANRKKRQVILNWLLNRFALDVRYPEAELNAIIKRHHPDTATIRREFIANKSMQRENNVYWRTPENPEE